MRYNARTHLFVRANRHVRRGRHRPPARCHIRRVVELALGRIPVTKQDEKENGREGEGSDGRLASDRASSPASKIPVVPPPYPPHAFLRSSFTCLSTGKGELPRALNASLVRSPFPPSHHPLKLPQASNDLLARPRLHIVLTLDFPWPLRVGDRPHGVVFPCVKVGGKKAKA